MITEDKVREIVKEELERNLSRLVEDKVRRIYSEESRDRELFLEKRLDRIDQRLEKLVTVTEENSKAIVELRKVTEENSKAIKENSREIAELRKVTEENSKAIKENSKQISDLTRVVSDLARSVEGLNKRVGGLENTFGIIMEDSVRRDILAWFLGNGFPVQVVKGKGLWVSNKFMEFDIYEDLGDRLVLGEVKVTLREKDVTEFAERLGFFKSSLKEKKEVIPVLVYRNKMGDSVEVAKGLGMRVLKYVKGGEFMEM